MHLRQMCAGLLARTGAESIGLLDRGPAELRGRDGRNELAPADAALVADDVDARDARTLDDVVAIGCRLDTRHLADITTQAAADAELVVVVLVEELEHARLQCLHHAATTTTHVGQAAHRLGADAVPRFVALGRGEA